jgi:hypothetical protein
VALNQSKLVTVVLLAAVSWLLTACGGGSSSASPSPVPADAITISGTVTFDHVPVTDDAGLDFAATFPAPARGIVVQLIGDNQVLAESSTDADGRYSLMLSEPRSVRVRARAEMRRSGAGGWHVRVVDNTAGNALYSVESQALDSADGSQQQNLHAASGWSGAGYSGPRAAAPFAILDVIHDAMALVQEVDATATFPYLQVHWSPLNAPVSTPSGTIDVTSGEIESSFYAPGAGIFILGAEDQDTDEFDRHVIAHEWAHFFEDRLARTDSQGGPHALGDHLDPRVAFSEGWANAFSALVTGDSIYKDALGAGQGISFAFDIAGEQPLNPGWFSEQSVHELIYALFAPEAASDGEGAGLGFSSLYATMTGALADSVALTTVFSFLDALKALRPLSDGPPIDGLTTTQAIAAVTDPWGSTETNSGYRLSNDVLPVYRELTVNGGAVNVCSSNTFVSFFSGAVNKLASRQFLRVNVPFSGQFTVTLRATSMPAGSAASPGVVLHRQGRIAAVEPRPGTACSPGDAPGNCATTLTRQLTQGTHVVEVHEWTNAHRDPDHAPIGRTCFDVEFVSGQAGKPAAPMDLHWALQGQPQPGVPVTLQMTLATRVDVAALQVSVHGSDGLIVTDARLPAPRSVAAGETVQFPVTVVPPANHAHLIVAVRAIVDGRGPAALLTIPIDPPDALASPRAVFATERRARVTVDARGERIMALPAAVR